MSFLQITVPMDLYLITHRHSTKNSQILDVTFCILYFSSKSCSTCFGQPCAPHQRNIVIFGHWSSCKVPVILVRVSSDLNYLDRCG